MPELDLDMIEELRRMRARPEAAGREWYRIQAKADARTAQIRIFDDIGWLGTSARSFADELDALDVEEIDLRLNSPGGEAWDGIAIYNALRKHPAKVTVTVDALAASAASVIAMAGDKVRMNRGSQMMIHDAWGLVIGNAADMQEHADVLDRLSNSLASIYAARTGGTVEEWRKAMGAESWYTATEAVNAGLADELVDDTSADAKARFDLKAYAFAYAGRDKAPPPVVNRRPDPPQTTTAPEPSGASSSPVTPAEAARRIHAASTRSAAATSAADPKKEGAGMDPAKIREALGLQADASDDEVKTALASSGLVAQPSPEPAPEPAATPEPKPELVHASGTMTIDSSAWAEREDRIKRLEAQAAKQARDERDKVIAQAVQDGKFAPARKDHWVRLWDADPEGTRQVIDSLARNVIPTAELGYAGDGGDVIDDEFKHLFPPSLSQKGA